jgi:replicative DNA helicase
MGDVAELRPERGQIPPHDLDAEAAVISAALIDPNVLAELEPMVRAEDFYADANRRIWEAIIAVDRDGKVDITTVGGWLRAKGLLDQVGGTPYLARVQDATPAVAHAPAHARIVAARGHQRRLIATLKKLAAEGYGDIGDPVEWGQAVEQAIYDCARFDRREADDSTLAHLVPKAMDALYAPEKDHDGAIDTGFWRLDRKLGGLKRGLVYVVGGRPGMGKSAFVQQIGTHVAQQGHAVVEISAEMPSEQIVRRKLAQCAQVGYKALEARKLASGDWDNVVTQSEMLRQYPLAVERLIAPTLGAVRASVRRCMARIQRHHGERKLGLVSIDYIQVMNPEHRKGENSNAEISRLSQGIVWLAGEFDCPVLLVSQLNRGPEHEPDKRPRMKHLRDSGSLEQDAYAVLFPFRPEYYAKNPLREDVALEECQIIVAKNRNGDPGDVPMVFHRSSMSFLDVADDYPEDERYR